MTIININILKAKSSCKKFEEIFHEMLKSSHTFVKKSLLQYMLLSLEK